MDLNQPNPPDQPPPSGQPSPPPYQPYGQPGQAPPYQQPPYQQPQQPYPPYQQPVPPYGGYAPPPQKRGPNWLAICGITCVVLVIVIVGCTWLIARPFYAIGLEIGKSAEMVATTDIATIKASAKVVSAQELAANPAAYKGQWVELNGVVSGTSMSGANDPFAQFNKQGGTGYVLDGGIFLTDISQKPPQGQTGSPIRAWGQAAFLDITKMPMIGRIIEQELAKDPSAPGPTTMIMFFAKEVEVTSAPVPIPVPGEQPATPAPGGEAPGPGAGGMRSGTSG